MRRRAAAFALLAGGLGLLTALDLAVAAAPALALSIAAAWLVRA